MLESFRIRIRHHSRERQISNALLALVTGVLTLMYPDFLYLIAGGYLVALGVNFVFFRIPPALSAVPIVAGIVILIFPELIPITFAIFLGLFGFVFLFAFQFSILGIIALIIAAMIIANPDWVAYLIATFLLLYAVTNLINIFQDWQGGRGGPQDGEPVSVQ